MQSRSDFVHWPDPESTVAGRGGGFLWGGPAAPALGRQGSP
ncbi:MAG TPA: hypothetical protein VG056_09935 [Pirellulales bacterium]|nr:hypothetical protein [Pirellulales bacterium]